jgi:hypothetical protein
MNSISDLLSYCKHIEDNMHEADERHIFVYQYKTVSVLSLSDNGILLSFTDETHKEISLLEINEIRVFEELT